jgi:hypothetical protein
MRPCLVITIDVEEDAWDQFHEGADTLENIERIPMLQALFERYGAVPTYLVNYAVLANGRATGILRDIYDKGRCEVGAHCHPWNTPPVRETMSNGNTYLFRLDAGLVREKIETITDALRYRFGTQPVSFRAGRWGFGPNVATVIRDCGYRIDTSITPFWDWREFGGPDFSDAPSVPYLFDPENVLEMKPVGALMEIPPTIGFLKGDFARAGRIRRRITQSRVARLHLMGMLDRVKVLSFRWLSPELWNGAEMVALAKSYLRSGGSVLNMSLHSVTLMPGKSEYIQEEAQVPVFLSYIETVLSWAAENGIQFSTLDAAGEKIRPLL